MVLPLLFSAALVLAGCMTAWKAVRLVGALTWAGLGLVAWPLRLGMRRYGRGLRDARVRP